MLNCKTKNAPIRILTLIYLYKFIMRKIFCTMKTHAQIELGDLQGVKDKMLVLNTEVKTKLTPVMMLFDPQKYFFVITILYS